MLIDGGNNADGQTIIDYLKQENVTKLEYVIATHVHEDHIGGLDNIITEFDTEKIIMSDGVSTTQTFNDLLNAISNKNLTITKAVSGDNYSFSECPFIILAPNSSNYDDANNYSVVLKLTNGKFISFHCDV